MIPCISSPGIPAATGLGLLQYARECYKQLYAQMDERAVEAPQENRRQNYQGSNHGA
jgi:hypothetical protein